MSDTTPDDETEIEVDLGDGTVFCDVLGAPTGRAFSELSVSYPPPRPPTKRDDDE